MANVSRVNGFRPVSTLTGAGWNGQITQYGAVTADATIIAVVDLVTLSGTTGVGAYQGYRGVKRAAASDALVGVVVGFSVVPDSLNTPQTRTANQARWVYVVDDPNAYVVAQEDGDTTPIAMASVGLNVDFIVAAANTLTGASGMQIDSSSVSTTATLPLKLVAPLAVSDNELTTSGQSYTRWVCKINNHQLGASTGTAGV